MLEDAGYIIRDANMKRTVRVKGAAHGVSHIPLVGTVTAGMPILATELIEDYIAVSGVSGNNLLALRDIVVVEQCPTAQNGDIVVALVGDEATVKRFYKENGHFRLQPENDKFEPIIVEECAIAGKVKALIRNY